MTVATPNNPRKLVAKLVFISIKVLNIWNRNGWKIFISDSRIARYQTIYQSYELISDFCIVPVDPQNDIIRRFIALIADIYNNHFDSNHSKSR